MKQADSYLRLVDKPDYKTNVLYQDAFNGDIIKALNSLVNKGTNQVTQLAPKFKGKTAKATAFNIWRFLRTHGRYVRDTNEAQLIREPKRFIHDTFLSQNSGDCKSFTLFTVSILRALGFEAFIKYAGYIPGLDKPSHVYSFTVDKNGNEILIDGCFPFFNREKKYTYSQTFNTKNMKVASLSGIDSKKDKAVNFYKNCSPVMRRKIRARLMDKKRLMSVNDVIESKVVEGVIIEGINGKKRKQKKTKAQKAEAKKKRRAKVKKGFKKFGTGVKFIALGAGRGAFLALVALNVAGWASKFKKLQQTKLPNGKNAFDSTILVKWKKLGGLEKLLRGAIKKGENKKPLFLSKKAKAKFQKAMKVSGVELDYIGDLDTINAIPVAAAAAAAVPVVAALIPVLMKAFKAIGAKKEVKQVAEEAKDLVQEQAPAVEQYQEEAAAEEEQAEEAAEEVAEEEAAEAEEIEGINAGQFDDLFKNLGQVAAAGVQRLGKVIQKKTAKKPKVQKAILKAGRAGDDYFTGRYVRESGAKKAAGYFEKALPFAAAAGVTYLVVKNK